MDEDEIVNNRNWIIIHSQNYSHIEVHLKRTKTNTKKNEKNAIHEGSFSTCAICHCLSIWHLSNKNIRMQRCVCLCVNANDRILCSDTFAFRRNHKMLIAPRPSFHSSSFQFSLIVDFWVRDSLHSKEAFAFLRLLITSIGIQLTNHRLGTIEYRVRHCSSSTWVSSVQLRAETIFNFENSFSEWIQIQI